MFLFLARAFFAAGGAAGAADVDGPGPLAGSLGIIDDEGWEDDRVAATA